jgi:hypothetical protein
MTDIEHEKVKYRRTRGCSLSIQQRADYQATRSPHTHTSKITNMRFTVATIVSLAAATTAAVIPRADYGGWNVTLSYTGGNDKQRTETVSGVYANSAFADNIPVTCHY